MTEGSSSERGDLVSPVCLDAPIRTLSYIPLVLNITLNSFICITAIFGNLLILVTIWRNQPLRSSPSTILLSGLALSDLCVGFISEPIYITLQVSLVHSGDTSCSLIVVSLVFNFFMSTVTFLTMILISIDRYLAISFHLRYQEIVTERRAKTVIFVLWLISGVSIPALLEYTHFYIWFTSAVITVGIVVVSFAWVRIYQVVRHHQVQIQDQMQIQGQQLNMARLRKSAVNTMFILFVFILCYSPFAAVLVMFTMGEMSNNGVLIYTYNLLLLNSSINPLVYCWRHRDIRAAVKQTLPVLLRF